MPENSDSVLADVARAVGAAAGKVASLAGAGEGKTPKPKENAYTAEYLGSGTFRISKPKRADAKRRQSALKAPRRGARK